MNNMLAVIIINYKNEQQTINYIEQEIKKITVPHKVVIVNNEATKQSNEILSNALNARIIYDTDTQNFYKTDHYIISCKENLGFAKGNNLGAQFALKEFSPNFILFTNNDIIIEGTNVVAKLLEKIQNNNNIGIIGPKVIGIDGRLQSPEPFFSFWDNYIWVYLGTFFYSTRKKRERFKMDYAEKAQEGFHYKLMGSFFIVKSDDFFACGMMDPNTFLYNEEAILSERMKKINKYAYYYPQVAVIHEHGNTIKKYNTRKRMRDLKFASASYYYKTYVGTSNFTIFLGKIIKYILNILHK